MKTAASLIACIVLLFSSETHAEWPKIHMTTYLSGLSAPTDIANAGDGSGRLFIVEKKGRILIAKDGKLSDKPFLDIRDRVLFGGSEQGLLGVAFPPGFKDKKYFYVNYTSKRGGGDTVVARYRVVLPDMADPSSEEILLTIGQPYSNHNGGQIAFGPDGYLYIGMGDGGSGGDPHNNGQNKKSLLGKMLRIDTESGKKPYGIPADNPFKDEIWATGLRNPWRFSFDQRTGDLYIADVGQNDYEEIDFQPAGSGSGKNYGWNIMEGAHCYRGRCNKEGLEMPVYEYGHSEGCSVTGGYVYRGEKYPALKGVYLFGDYCSGKVWGLRRKGEIWESAFLLDTPYSISTFGEDEAGNIYLADYGRGIIYLLKAD